MRCAWKFRGALLLGAIICLLTLSACGTPTKTDEEVVADIARSDSFISEYGITIESQSVGKHNVNKKAGTDTVNVSVDASCLEFSYSASYQVSYVLEDEQWVLDTCEKLEDSYLALTEVPEDTAASELKGKYATYTLKDDQKNDNEQTFLYSAIHTENGITGEFEVTLTYAFEPGGWKVASTDELATRYYGSCGQTANWALESDGTLTIQGTGELPDYGTEENPNAPWCTISSKNLNVRKVNIDDGIAHLGTESFKGCDKLIAISIPDSMTGMADDVLEDCQNLAGIDFNGSIARWMGLFGNARENIDGFLFNGEKIDTNIIAYGKCGDRVGWVLDKEKTALTVGGEGEMGSYGVVAYNNPITPFERVFPSEAPYSEHFRKIRYVAVEEGVTNVGFGSFAGCERLEKIAMAETVKDIGGSAFEGCYGLTTVEFPKTLNSIGWAVFSHCESLEKIVLPEGITKLETLLFEGCTHLHEVTFPKSIQEKGENCFMDCDELTDFYYTGSLTEWNATIGYQYPRVTMHFGEENRITQEDALKIAYEFYGKEYVDHSDDYGLFEGFQAQQPEIIDGITYYVFDWYGVVESANGMANLRPFDRVYVNSETGKASYSDQM